MAATENQLSKSAKIFLGVLFALSAILLVPSLAQLSLDTEGWVVFFIFGGAAAAAQLFPVHTLKNNAFTPAIVFMLPAVFLLPPPLIALMPIVMHLPEWLRVRYPWFMQSFNIANHTIDLFAAYAVANIVLDHAPGTEQQVWAMAGVAATLVYVALNHSIVALMLRLARGMRLRETGLLSFQSLSNEMVVGLLGFALVSFWQTNPWLIPIGIAPMLLIHRSLAVPALEEEARVDPKTGLFNARHFASALSEELGRATRFERPLSLIMADLDLLRDINNTYGHLAGDAVLKGIAQIFRQQLRHYDVPARFGGEEFSILLPETPPEQALEIAERIRRAVAEAAFEVETSSEPIRATVSIGVAGVPKDATDANELIHQADLAVYRAKLQGRNRVLGASEEQMILNNDRPQRILTVADDADPVVTLPRAVDALPVDDRRPQDQPRPHAVQGPRFLALSKRLGLLIAAVSASGIAAGVLGLIYGTTADIVGLLAIVTLVGIGQAVALTVSDEIGGSSISLSAVGAIAGAALFGPRAALALAVTIAIVDWSAQRIWTHQVLFNIGALALASLSAAGAFAAAGMLELTGTPDKIAMIAAGVLAGFVYFLVNMSLVSVALAMEGHERWLAVFKERFAWLWLHYLVYGFVAGVMAVAYGAAGLWGLGVFAVPLLLMRKTQESYLAHTQRSVQKLRAAAETIQTQNISLEQANRLIKERSTAAMESLSATVDARDSYTAGHSRRVQQLALAIGRELGLSQAELDLLGHAALFHDIGKLAIPDAILLKPASLTSEEWALMQRHAEEGARIIDRLGFLGDAVPAIRHHHERFDGTGYPDRISGEEIPLGARIIHVADALDSMLTTRIYRAARPPADALTELRRASGSQFCPRCVAALERILPLESLQDEQGSLLAAVS
ncbi:MAG TPA: diguanylate cyclase [Gaiellaceae bacterium]|nr:diguanylate cyclase [Gaiellaceae bacterium]